MSDHLFNNERKSSNTGSMEKDGGGIENIELSPMPQINKTDATQGNVDDIAIDDVSNENNDQYDAITPDQND